jgi:hypothetical protein
MEKNILPRSSMCLGLRICLTDGSVHSFAQTDDKAAKKLWGEIDPARIFARQRIVIGSRNSKTIFVSAEISRIDFFNVAVQPWTFPGGYSDVVELSEAEFREHAHLDEPAKMPVREQCTPPGDLLVSFAKLHMRGSCPLYAMIELPAKLPAESQSFMQFMLSKSALFMRLREGGMGVLNLSNLVSYTVYPGLAQLPADAWPAEPDETCTNEPALSF